jgi:hypothetical protein
VQPLNPMPSRTSILAASRTFVGREPDESVRNPDWMADRFADRLGTRGVAEVDRAATQPQKRRHVETLLHSLPSHVTCAPMDLTCARLGGVLPAAGHDPSRPALDVAEGLKHASSG